MKKSNVFTVLKVIILSILVLIIGANVVSQKENMTIDEFFTYGLSNTQFQLDVEDYKNYTGKEVFLDYMTVHDGHEFDVGNVIFNQKMDTHPPLYYMMVNFICSLNKGTFSMWYGLIINVIFLVALFWEMRYLFDIVIKDKVSSTILSLLSFFTYGFVNEIAFTRMYVVLSVFSMGFVILIIDKIEEMKENVEAKFPAKSDIAFLIKFFVICVLGILTQYHFAFIAFFFSIIFAYHLIKDKNIKLLVATFITGLLSIIVAYLLFPGMLNHILSGDSLHSLTNIEKVSTLENFRDMLFTVKRTLFGSFFFVYVGILIILIIIDVINKKKKHIKIFEDYNKYYFYFLFSSILYYVLVSFTSIFAFERYLYPVYPFILIAILTPIYMILKNIAPVLKYLTIGLLFILCLSSTLSASPTNLCIGDSLFEQFLYENKKVKSIFCYHSIDSEGNENSGKTSKWKLPYSLYLFRHMENMTFIDTGHMDILEKMQSETITGNDKVFLIIYTTQNDNEIIRAIQEKNNLTTSDKVYFTSYIHVYLLGK